MPSKNITNFVALVTDGHAIDGFGTRCDKCGQPTEVSDGRKDRFLKLGRSVMKELAKLLGIDPKEVSVYPAGPASSGDVCVYSRKRFQIALHHRLPRNGYGDFCAGYGGDRNAWFRWEDLLDLRGVAKKIEALKGPATEEA